MLFAEKTSSHGMKRGLKNIPKSAEVERLDRLEVLLKQEGERWTVEQLLYVGKGEKIAHAALLDDFARVPRKVRGREAVDTTRRHLNVSF